MNYYSLTTFSILASILAYSNSQQYVHHDLGIPIEWIDMHDTCTNSVRCQIVEELQAAMQYMAMGAFFSQDIVNRLGFAELFFQAATEEREHAIQLISYLLMRGGLTKDVSTLIQRNLFPIKTSWPNGVSALKDALKLEASVTKKIHGLIQACEETEAKDCHFVDYLTSDFLGEQYTGSREIAGKISSLAKMMEEHGPLGEWLYDKKLLNGEIGVVL